MQKIHFACLALIVAIAVVMPSADAQRPSYAGSRPSGGHNQKDKYNPTVVVNRFGETDTTTINTIAFGASQRPPVGASVVQPQSSYVPLAPISGPQFSVDNRFGADATSQTLDGGAAVGTSSGLLPLDAHGDQQLIDKLNRFPVDNRPFWFLNFEAIEAQRNGTAPLGAGGVGSQRGSFQG